MTASGSEQLVVDPQHGAAAVDGAGPDVAPGVATEVATEVASDVASDVASGAASGAALLVLSLASVPALSRLLAGGAHPRVWLPIGAAVVAAHLVCRVAGHRRWRPLVTASAALLVSAIVALSAVDPRVVQPGSGAFVHLAPVRSQLAAAERVVLQDGTPLRPLPGVVMAFAMLAAITAVAACLLQDLRWSRGPSRLRALVPLVPSFALVTYTSLVSAETGRVLVAVSYVSAVLIYVTVTDRAVLFSLERSSGTRIASSGRSRWPAVGGGWVTPMLALGVVVLAGSLLSNLRLTVLEVPAHAKAHTAVAPVGPRTVPLDATPTTASTSGSAAGLRARPAATSPGPAGPRPAPATGATAHPTTGGSVSIRGGSTLPATPAPAEPSASSSSARSAQASTRVGSSGGPSKAGGLSEVGGRGHSPRVAIHRRPSSVGVLTVVAIVVSVLCLGAAALWVRRRRRRARSRAASLNDQIVDSWHRAQRAVRRQGLQRRPVETPAEYADRLRHSGVEACASTINALVDLAVLVELASYGASPCTAREVDEARRLAHQVRGSTRRARAAGRFADRRGSLVGVGATSSADGGTVVP